MTIVRLYRHDADCNVTMVSDCTVTMPMLTIVTIVPIVPIVTIVPLYQIRTSHVGIGLV